MSEPRAAPSLFPNLRGGDAGAAHSRTGILPFQGIRELVRAKEIVAARDIEPKQVQPASLDLRLGGRAHRVRASFLPGRDCTVARKIEAVSLHEIDLANGAVLETGCVYVVELQERLNLSSQIAGWANPKSSIGRLDVFTRLITDNADEFDRIPAGYKGPLYAEVSPLTFSIVVRRGSRLSQIRFGRGSPTAPDSMLRAIHERVALVGDEPGQTKVRKGGTLDLTIDLAGQPRTGLVGYRAKKHTALIDVDVIAGYDPTEFWDPIVAPRRQLILDPNEFYILASHESVRVPPDFAAEMVAYDTQVGEFRAHYAGFFDPGFGYRPGNGPGTRAVLEVRSHKVPFILEHGQIVGRLVYERMAAPPDSLYGEAIGSSYQEQGLALSKHFKPFAGRT